MVTITEDYVSFETAKLLKEKGFNEPCYLGYNKNGEYFPTGNRNNSQIIQPDFCFICCPTLQMAMKWLREKKCVTCVIPLTFYFGENVSSWGYNIWADDNLEVDEDNTPKFTTYEEACEAAIKYCLENLI